VGIIEIAVLHNYNFDDFGNFGDFEKYLKSREPYCVWLLMNEIIFDNIFEMLSHFFQ
jgi:hypothetical protein